MDILEIPVTYKNKDLIIKAELVRLGYVHQILLNLEGAQITIETDEEGAYRVLGDANKAESPKVDLELVKAIVAVLESL